MSIVTRLVIVIGAAAALILPTLVPLAIAVDVPSSVEIEAPTCGLEFAQGSQTTLDYGSLMPDELTGTKGPITVTNTGNSEGGFFISGTEWVDTSDVIQMRVQVTHYSPNEVESYDARAGLIGTPNHYADLAPGSDYSLYFELKAVLENPPFSGALTQTVILGTEC